MKVIRIKSYGAISPAGSCPQETRDSYRKGLTLIKEIEIEGRLCLTAGLSEQNENLLNEIHELSKYKKVDRSVLMAIYAAREALKNAPQNFLTDKKVLVNIGSSRGATSLFEKYHRQHLEKDSVPVQTSPTTTLGNISSWVAQDLMCNAQCLSTSVTCSTALQAIGNALAWLKSGMAEIALAGASEAPLTAFTVAQMQAFRIYADDFNLEFPCQPCAATKPSGSGMVLGEGAALFLLEEVCQETAIAENSIIIDSFGYGSEMLQHATSMSDEADCLYDSMSMALKAANCEVDAVILHATGTDRGDSAELKAIDRVFPSQKPLILSNKWLVGHTLGSAGALNLEYAMQIIKEQSYTDFPYPVSFENKKLSKIRAVMINAAGFGGNAASLIVRNA